MIINNVPPAHPQNRGVNPAFFGSIIPTKDNIIIPTKTNPIISRILFIVFLISLCQIKKIYGFVNHDYRG